MPGRVSYLWQVRSSTVRVDLELVDNLNKALADPRHKKGDELGGILLGRILAPGEIEITDFEFVPSEHRRGAIYDLGLREQSAFAKKVAALKRRSRQKPVGFFRTHVRRGLFLDQDDFLLMSEAFSDPSQIAMLIRPGEPGPANAGIFLWENGDIDRRQTPLPFPFNSETLRAQGPISVPFEPLPAIGKPASQPRAIRFPAIPIRWVAWGATAGVGALALGAVLPRLHAPNSRQAEPVQMAKTIPHRAAVSAPLPATAPTPAPGQEPAPVTAVAPAESPLADAEVFTAPKPDEGPSAEPETPAKVFVAPRPAPAPRVEPERVAVVMPPPIPAPRSAPVTAPSPAAAATLPNIPPTTAPVVAAPREKAVSVAVNIEPKEASEIRRVASRLPLLGHLAHVEGGKDFSPASPSHPLEPRVPKELASDLAGEFQVDVRLSIDKRGLITNREVVHGAGTQFATLALNDAGEASWEPAHEGTRNVSSDVIVHYLFRSKATAPATAAQR